MGMLGSTIQGYGCPGELHDYFEAAPPSPPLPLPHPPPSPHLIKARARWRMD